MSGRRSAAALSLGDAQRVGAIGVAVALAAQILVVGAADHAAHRAIAHRAPGRRHGDPRQPGAALGVDHHALTGLVVGVARVAPLDAAAGLEAHAGDAGDVVAQRRAR